ncbi:MAG: hypothetical protein WCO96_03720 [Actinomycetes bacterium]
MKTIAVDWSGAKAREGAAGIAVAVVTDGRLSDLVSDIGRSDAIQRVIDEAAGGDLIAGFDFSFSLPAWFLEERGLAEAPDLWDLAAVEGEDWLSRCEPPFWGRAGTRKPTGDAGRAQLRETDTLTISESGVGPRQARSPFQVSGAGSVGASTVRGLPHLRSLRDAGFSIWPWDDAKAPVAIEIWTRLALGDTVKSDPAARAAAVQAERRIPERLADRAVSSEDCFDATLSALWLWDHSESILAGRRLSRPADRLEGRTWIPTPADKA